MDTMHGVSGLINRLLDAVSVCWLLFAPCSATLCGKCLGYPPFVQIQREKLLLYSKVFLDVIISHVTDATWVGVVLSYSGWGCKYPTDPASSLLLG